MILIGRLTKDGSITTLKDERQVLNFSIAINDWYKAKGSDTAVKHTTYINCAYWISMKFASRLTKGTLVELSGRIYVNPYIGFDGEVKATLNCHVNAITIHQAVKSSAQSTLAQERTVVSAPATDDLPF